MGEKKRRLAARAAGKHDDRPALAHAARAQALTAQSAGRSSCLPAARAASRRFFSPMGEVSRLESAA
jgi:hypothetical protein